MFASPSQIMFSIGDFNIYNYGVVLATAIAVGVLFSDWAGNKWFGLKKDAIIDLAPYLIIFGIIGARLYYCFLDIDFYLRFPTEIAAIRHGGISIHGAIFGGFIGLIIYAKRHKESIPKLCDVCSVGLILSQAIGRWGNFFNSEAYGLPTTLPWKLYIAEQYRKIPYTNFEYFHPTFLYESILDLIIFFILVYISKNKLFKKSGNIALLYLILYSAARIPIEYLRIDSVSYIFGIPVAIIVSASIIIVSLILLLRRNNTKNKKVTK